MLLILSLGILFLNTVTNQSISKFLRSIASPIWRVEARVVASPLGAYFLSKESLLKENKELKNRLNEAKLDLLLFPVLESENKELKLLLGRVSGDTRLLATVLVPPHRNKYDTLVIDIGEDQPVSKGDLVVAHPNVPIGIISSLNGKTALVSLFSDPDRETNSLISGVGPTTLVGLGGGNFKIELPRSAVVNVGDVVRLPDLESRVVGVVGEIEANPTDAFKKIIVNSPINIFSLRFVEIVVGN
jgi:rod shape-determining protein MreC|tara:strand:+ start:16025 stop:16756 length:732 start_codon:yes stop_codon:yes gene_type:complete